MKPAYKSLTVIAVLVAGAIEAAEKQGWLPEGATTTVAQFAALVTAVYGRWRADQPLSLT
jgi:hypothetical protein